jgi:FtsP/CotA-like multicopper oxidase with cupredoxin domain
VASFALSGCNSNNGVPQQLPLAADELREPLALVSQNGLLDVLMVAHAAPVAVFAPFQAPGWVYTICPRPTNGSSQCPTSDAQANDYGGTRLQLNPGDKLKVHLVNQLPPAPDTEHANDFGMLYLAVNPTNIHTHGLLVSPNYASQPQGVWGDNVFVLAFNTTYLLPPAGYPVHGTVQYDTIDYEYDIPPTHPSGLYWFHPHVHGISKNQITGGMAGIITIGQVTDYLCHDAGCAYRLASVPVRHLILKDSQIEHWGLMAHDQDSAFCAVDDSVGSTSAVHEGGCDGSDQTANGGSDHTGGRWYFTLNGQAYPTLTLGAPSGQIWRLTNASASATYELNLWQPDEQREIPVKVLSIDGVSIDNGDSTSPDELIDVVGNRFQPIPCLKNSGASGGVCTTRLHLMPSSRAEIWVTYRNAQGVPVTPPAGARAVLRTNGFDTGPAGDNWPAIDLAKVAFGIGAVDVPALASSGQLKNMREVRAIAASLTRKNAAVPAAVPCTALAPGHKRRIFFNSFPDPELFGLGYEELDENGVPVPGTFQDVQPFDPDTPTICLPLAPGNQPVVERWELVNLAGEDHNFHIHQVHFRVLSAVEVAGTALPDQISGRGITMDSLPLLHADGTCNSVADWRNGACATHAATVEIPFEIAGDYVYHCHILEHEDGGMMAVIRVRPAEGNIALRTLDRVLTRLGLKSAPPPTLAQLGAKICRTRRDYAERPKLQSSSNIPTQ